MHPFFFFKKYTAFVILGLLAVACAGIWSVLLVPEGYGMYAAAQATGVESPSLGRVSALLDAYPGPLAARTKTAGCAVRGPLPDAACTPGSVFANATPEVICVSGYSKRVRSVSTSLRKQVYAAYGIAYPPPTGTYELDHLIPLAIGGDNSAANLFPEAAEPRPGFKEKDVVEVYLQEAVCAGEIDLADAQSQVAKDWVALFNAIDPQDVSRIRQKYTSWAN